MTIPSFIRRAAFGLALLAYSAAQAGTGPTPDAYEPDDTIAQAQLLEFNGLPQPRTLHVPTDEDYVAMYLTVGPIHELRLEIGDDLRDAADAVFPNECKLSVEIFVEPDVPLLYSTGSPVQIEEFCAQFTPDGPEITLAIRLGDTIVAPEGTYYARVKTVDGVEVGDPALVQVAGSYDLLLANPEAGPTGVLSGAIVSASTLQAIPDANIRFRNNADANLSDSDFSRLNGSFLKTLEQGTYQLRVSKAGFVTVDYTVEATVVPEQTVPVPTIQLQPLVTALPPDIRSPQLIGSPGSTNIAAQAFVDPKGAVTTSTFQAVPTGAGNTVSGTDPVQVGETVSFTTLAGLSSCTAYELRVSAVNSQGSDPTDTPDEVRSFMTACAVPPVINSFSATPSATGAMLSATINGMNLDTLVKFEYKRSNLMSYTSTTELLYNASSTPFTANASVSGLTCNTTYDYRVVARNTANGGASATSAVQQFTTSACPPATIGSLASSNLQRTQATVSGQVTTMGSGVTIAIDYRRVGDTPYISAASFQLSHMVSAQTVMTTISGLVCATSYQFRISGSGGATSQTSTFTTSNCTRPIVSNTQVVSTNLESATLAATIDTRNLAVADVHFEYRVAGSGGAYTPTAAMMLEPTPTTQQVSEVIGPLTCGTTYEYRVVATNVDGTQVQPGATNASTVACGDVVFRNDFE